ncbi:hypothetical protein Entas_0491 [Enterobacter soli]|nr:hypothetical protein Entas_0491 [Enterobacter soli]
MALFLETRFAIYATPFLYLSNNTFRAVIFSIFGIKNKICPRGMFGKSFELSNQMIAIFLCFTIGRAYFLH